MEDGPMRVEPGAPDTTHMPVIQATPSSPRRSSLPSVDVETRGAHDDASESAAHADASKANEQHSALWRKFVGAGVACVGAGVAALGVSSTTPATAQPPAPITLPMNQAAPPNQIVPSTGPRYDKPIVVVVPPSIRPAPAPQIAPPAQVAPAHTAPAPQVPAPPAHVAPAPQVPAPAAHVTPAPVQQQGTFAFSSLPAGAKLGVNGTFTTTVLFSPTAIRFAGNAQVLKSDANNLVLRINASGVDGIARGQSRVAQLSFSSIDAKHVRFIAQDVTGQSTTTSTLTVVASSAAGTQLRAPDGTMVTLTDAKGTLTISYAQNVIRVAHPTAAPGDS
jgi:hypothetical protein